MVKKEHGTLKCTRVGPLSMNMNPTKTTARRSNVRVNILENYTAHNPGRVNETFEIRSEHSAKTTTARLAAKLGCTVLSRSTCSTYGLIDRVIATIADENGVVYTMRLALI